MKKIRCIKCGKLLLELEGKAEITCPRCKTKNVLDTKGSTDNKRFCKV